MTVATVIPLVLAVVGPKALYLLLIWLISAAAGGWLTERKGYGERLGLTLGLLLTFVGLLISLALPGRPGSVWKLSGPLPRRAGRAVTPPAGARRADGPADRA